MLRCLICCALQAMLLTGCAEPQKKVVFVTPHVPVELRQPCPQPSFAGVTSEGVFSDKVVALAAANRCANGKIVTIDKILTDSEMRNGN